MIFENVIDVLFYGFLMVFGYRSVTTTATVVEIIIS